MCDGISCFIVNGRDENCTDRSLVVLARGENEAKKIAMQTGWVIFDLSAKEMHYAVCDQVELNPPPQGKHLCKYCGGLAEGADDNVLCPECRETFGHAFYSEL